MNVLYIVCLSVAVLLFVLLYILRWRDYTLVRKVVCAQDDCQNLPGVSIVIPAHNQAPQLEENLPKFVSQNYKTFEVIVVDIHSSDETAEVVKRMENINVPVRIVKLPVSSRYIGKNRLAMSLGIRAAHFPWVLFTQPDCCPAGNDWLTAIAKEFSEDKNLVIGMATYEDRMGIRGRLAVYEYLRGMFSNLRALKRGKAIDADIRNFAIRKSFYLNAHPLSEKLYVPFGEAPLMADSFGLAGQTAFAANADATVFQMVPHRRMFPSLRMYRAEVNRHKSFRAYLYRLREAMATWCLFLFIAVVALFSTVRVLDSMNGGYKVDFLAYDIPMLLLLMLAIILPLLLMRKACRFLNIRSFGMLPLWFDLTQPLRNMVSKARRWYHRHDFVRPIIPSTDL